MASRPLLIRFQSLRSLGSEKMRLKKDLKLVGRGSESSIMADRNGPERSIHQKSWAYPKSEPNSKPMVHIPIYCWYLLGQLSQAVAPLGAFILLPLKLYRRRATYLSSWGAFSSFPVHFLVALYWAILVLQVFTLWVEVYSVVCRSVLIKRFFGS